MSRRVRAVSMARSGSAAAHPACRSGGPSRQRSLPLTTTPSHRRGERGPDCRPASSPRGTASYTGGEPSTASLQCGSCGGEKGGPNRTTHRRTLSSSPGGLLPRGPHQNRTRRFPPSGSSADVAHGDAPQIRTRIRGTRSTTFRISGDMSPDVNAPVMGPFESSHQHGPPLLGRVRGSTRSPTSSLV